MEDMIVQDDAGEEEAERVETQTNVESKPIKIEIEIDIEDKVSRKRENQEEPEAVLPKKPCLEKEFKTEDDLKAENNTDAEDSINLDLGDDELLNEEVGFYFFKVTVKLSADVPNITNGYVMEVD